MTVSDETARRAPSRRERTVKTTNVQPLESTYALYPRLHCQGREYGNDCRTRILLRRLTGGGVPSQRGPASVSRATNEPSGATSRRCFISRSDRPGATHRVIEHGIPRVGAPRDQVAARLVDRTLSALPGLSASGVASSSRHTDRMIRGCARRDRERIRREQLAELTSRDRGAGAQRRRTQMKIEMIVLGGHAEQRP